MLVLRERKLYLSIFFVFSAAFRLFNRKIPFRADGVERGGEGVGRGGYSFLLSFWCPETLFISHEDANFLFSVFRMVQGEAKTPKIMGCCRKKALGGTDLTVTLPLKTEVEIFRGMRTPLVPVASYAPELNTFPENVVIFFCSNHHLSYADNGQQKIMWGIWMKDCTRVGSKMGTQTKK